MLVCALLSLCLADQEPYFQSAEYNEGVYGEYVSQKYTSADVSAPVLNIVQSFTNCDDGSYLFITPRGEKVTPTLVILDARYMLSNTETSAPAHNVTVAVSYGPAMLIKAKSTTYRSKSTKASSTCRSGLAMTPSVGTVKGCITSYVAAVLMRFLLVTDTQRRWTNTTSCGERSTLPTAWVRTCTLSQSHQAAPLS